MRVRVLNRKLTYHGYMLCLYSQLCQFKMGNYDMSKINCQQKHAISIIFHKDKFSHTKELFVQNKVFNLYQLNI